MKNFRITLLAFCILGGFAIQAQNHHWAVYPLKKFDLANQTLSNLPGVAAICSTGPVTPDTQGLFDTNGNPVFYVHHDQIHDKNGQVRGFIPGLLPNNRSNYCIQSMHIVPVPNGGCGEYYLIYTKQTEINSPSTNSPDAYEVGAMRITVGTNQNITVSNNIQRLTYRDPAIAGAGYSKIATALSQELNQERMLYVSFKKGASPFQDQVVRIRVTNTGLVQDGGFGVYSTLREVTANTLELSPNQRYLAWVNRILGVYRITVVDLQNNNSIQDIIVSGLNDDSELEFGTNNDDIYVTTGAGVIKTSRSNPQSVSTIAGTSSIHSRGEIELSFNNQLYATATNGQLYVINLNASTPIATSVANNFPLTLPEQVDGETIVHIPLTISLTVLITGQVQANVAGGSGNYTFNWTHPSDPQTGNPAWLRGKGTYTLIVTDNVSGCMSTIQYTNQPSLGEFRHHAGSQEELHHTEIKAYPNPTADRLNVQVNQHEKIVQLQVVDLQGQVLNQWDGNQKATQHIATNDLKQGTYLLMIITDKLRHQVKFFVK